MEGLSHRSEAQDPGAFQRCPHDKRGPMASPGPKVGGRTGVKTPPGLGRSISLLLLLPLLQLGSPLLAASLEVLFLGFLRHGIVLWREGPRALVPPGPFLVLGPVSRGVPLEAGAVTDSSELHVLGPDGQEVPSQYRVLARWWKKDNSIRWVLVDFIPTN